MRQLETGYPAYDLALPRPRVYAFKPEYDYTLRSLLTPEKHDTPAPHLDRVTPLAAMPGGDIEIHGQHLEPHGDHIPRATIGDVAAPVTLSRPTRATIQIPEGTISGNLVLHRSATESNPINLSAFAVPMCRKPAPRRQSRSRRRRQRFYTRPSLGARRGAVPVSIFQIQRDFQIRPFVRELLNATGLLHSTPKATSTPAPALKAPFTASPFPTAPSPPTP